MKYKLRASVVGVLLGTLMVFGAAVNWAQPAGVLDTTFSLDGRSVELVGDGGGSDYLAGTALQADGKQVATGTVKVGTTDVCVVVRYNSDGSPDLSFDEDGRLFIEAGTQTGCNAVAIQPDGRIIAAGNAYDGVDNYFALFRVNANGSLDETFDGDGRALTDVVANSRVYSIVLRPDGRIYAAGYTFNNGSGNFALARYNADGSLDTSFDGDGIVITSVGSGSFGVNGVAIQDDGKLVAAGAARNPNFLDTALVRYNDDGSLDASFDGDGKVTTNFPGTGSSAYGVAIQGDGRIVAAGYNFNGTSDMAMIRYNTDGSLDTTFDSDGKLTTDFAGASERAYSIAIGQDGKILAGGYSGPNGSEDVALARYNSDGSLDNAFDGDGKATTALLDGDYAQTIIIQPDGKIAAVGFTLIDGINPFGALLRYHPDGSLDTSFDGDGIITVRLGSGTSSAQAVAIQPDGKIVAAGYSGTGATLDFTVIRYNTDGSLDTFFDSDGKVTTDFFTGLDRAYAVEVQPDGKIVVAGFTSHGSVDEFALARYNPDGSLDSSFDFDGRVTTNLSSISAAYSLAIQTDGKIVAGGFASDGFSSDFALARFNANGSLDPTFDGDGRAIVSIAGDDEIYAIELQGDGKIVASGSAYTGSRYEFALARFNTDGSLDTSFNEDGRVTTDVATTRQGAEGLALQADGKIVTAGLTNLFGPTQDDFGLVRYNPDGSLDTSFDGDGVLVSDVSGADIARSVAIQTDGKIIAAGGSGRDVALVRYNSDGSLDASYGAGGKSLFDMGRGASDQAFDVVIDNQGRAVAVGDSGGLFAIARVLGDLAASSVPFDYDADGRTDFSVFRPSDGAWYLQKSTEGFFGMLFGFATDKIVPADFDGDGKTDIAIFRPADLRWYIANSSDGSYRTEVFGLAEDLPAPADYDGDGKADLCVFRPSDGTWYLQRSSNGSFLAYQFGAATDKPTVGDFDGDGLSDFAVFRTTNGEWYQSYSSDGSIHGEQFGFPTDKLAYADYDGDGETDLAVFRPSDRIFYIRNSATATYDAFVFGLSEDIPTPGDYDGDGRADLSVFRPSDGNWYRQNSSNGSFNAFNFGLNGDRPTPTAYQ